MVRERHPPRSQRSHNSRTIKFALGPEGKAASAARPSSSPLPSASEDRSERHRQRVHGICCACHRRRGCLSSCETTVLLNIDETMEALRIAKSIRYRSPGSVGATEIAWQQGASDSCEGRKIGLMFLGTPSLAVVSSGVERCSPTVHFAPTT